MDYDNVNIADYYDQARALTTAGRRLWQDLLSTHLDRTAISLVVDLGCGTGRFSELLAAHLGTKVIAIDPSQKMVDQGRRKRAAGNILFQRAAAEALPLSGGCVDLVFMSQVYHHFTDPLAVARECWRVLRAGGYVCVRNTTRESDFAYRHFFPLDRLIDSELPTGNDIGSIFVGAGFTPAIHQIVIQVVAPDWPTFVQKSALRADSFLARLPDEEFSRGMIELRAHVAEIDPGEPVTEEIDWFVFSRSA